MRWQNIEIGANTLRGRSNMHMQKRNRPAESPGHEADQCIEKPGRSKPPVLTGDPRTDQALLALARLVSEIAANPQPIGHR